MNEEELESSIGEYETQIGAIVSALDSSELSIEDRTEFETIKSDLEELIEITKDQLLDIKKSNLLVQYDDIINDQSNVSNEICDSPSTSGLNEEIDDFNDFLDQIVGLKCRAPYGLELGHKLPLDFHNAVILDVITPENCDIDDIMLILEVRVLYSNPMYRKMKPCNFYLQDRCTFGDQCRFSHGEKVKFCDLMEYLEPNFENISTGQKCLAKTENSEDLWYLSEVTSFCAAENQVAVRVLQTNKESAVNYENVLPLPEFSESASSSTNEEHNDLLLDGTQMEDYSEQKLGEKGSLGHWEEHTRGIGSKLMAKMGYILGQGLGKNNAGRVEPVEARILPKGKSLDACMALKEQKGLKGVKKANRKKKLKKKRIISGKATNAIESGIFDFINRKLAGEKIEGKSADKQIKEETIKNLNVKLFKLDEEAKQTQRELSNLKQALARNSGRDQVVANQIQSKIDTAQSKLLSLNSQGNAIHSEQRTRKDKKKLAIF